MGCARSAPEEPPEDAPTGEESQKSLASNASGSKLSNSHNSAIHKRLQKLQELDATTKVPFILVELRGLSHENGFIEVCGKDEYGVYAHLEEWLKETWDCNKLDAGDLSEETQVPFCDALFEWKGFKMEGEDGLNNMGMATMKLVHYMCGTLGWTLGVVNGGNVGKLGEIREQQVIFKAPHPMNFVVPHMMIELRSAGYIEVCGDGADNALDQLEEFFLSEFKAERIEGHEEYADRYYKAGDDVFKERGSMGENNLGMLTTQVCDAIVKIDGWSLVTCNGGNYGEAGTHREQQLVFRWDNHPMRSEPHLLVELRDAGYVEVCGVDKNGIYSKLHGWLSRKWNCVRMPGAGEFCSAKYKWEVADDVKDMMVATGQIVGWFHTQGWQMTVASQGTIKCKGVDDCREQQIIFRSGGSEIGVLEPHLIIELYMGEGNMELYEDDTATQLLGNQHVRMCPVGNCKDAVESFHKFIIDYMEGKPGDKLYSCDIFLSRGMTDNNLGQWTMRVCDFMVDCLGWSFIVCNVCNMGEWGQFREQQLIFRWDGEKRSVPRGNSKYSLDISQFMDQTMPSYWTVPEVLNGDVVQKAIPCTGQERRALQELTDKTFRRILTRDRVYEYQITTKEEMPFRLEVVHAFRSEHAYLWLRMQEKRSSWSGEGGFEVKGSDCANLLQERLADGEAYLFHGTNPSSAMSIMKHGFSLDAAGANVGTMFGYGIYLAECSSKSDEYARDDGGNTFPGLMALLVCRSLVGKPFVVQDPGDHVAEAKGEGCDCICGDRESKVGTYREFVLFDEAQVFPEYTIIYRRNYDERSVPQFMRTTAKGTTGRNWQVRLDTKWANVAPEANFAMLQAIKEGKPVVMLDIAGTSYTFDIEAKEQTNNATGKKRQLRPPMVT